MLAVAACEQLPVAEARAGTPEAWDVLFQRYQLPLYVYVFELIRHEQTSLDIVQETFLNALRHINSLREDEKFGGWLFGIAHQKCIQHWRRKGRDERALDVAAAGPFDFEPGPDELLIRQEDEAEFMKRLRQLSAPHRSVLLLHFVEEFSVEEIAVITETEPGTVKSRLHYARRALRKIIEQSL
jgi:RNA polymerase sigma-70 factor (ECF subfamily)